MEEILLPDAALTSTPSEERSSRYALVNTASVIDVLKQSGWNVVRSASKQVRKAEKKAFAKHIVELEHSLYSPLQDGDRLRVHVLNSHDGTSSFILRLGIFRLVCGNGLVISKGTAQEFRIRHLGFSTTDVENALSVLLERAAHVAEAIDSMRARQLSPGNALAFATAAAMLKYRADADHLPLNPASLLMERRFEDKLSSVWHVFNRVQENLMRGGVPGLTATGKARRTREVRSIDEQSRVNLGLWELALHA